MATTTTLLSIAILSQDPQEASRVSSLLQAYPSVGNVAVVIPKPEIASLNDLVMKGFNVAIIDADHIDERYLLNVFQNTPQELGLYALIFRRVAGSGWNTVYEVARAKTWRNWAFFRSGLTELVPQDLTYLLETLAEFYRLESEERRLSTVADDSKVSERQAEISSRKDEARATIQASVVAGIRPEVFEEIFKDTIAQSRRLLFLTTAANIGALGVGMLIVIIALIYSVITGSWVGVGFGAVGIAGVIAAFIKAPLQSIGIGARRLVQVQIAYVAFINQLQRLAMDSDRVGSIELSKQLGAEMERTLKALDVHYG